MGKYFVLNYATYLCLNVLVAVDESYGDRETIKQALQKSEEMDNDIFRILQNRQEIVFEDDAIDGYDKNYIINNCMVDYIRYIIACVSDDPRIPLVTIGNILKDFAKCLDLWKDQKIYQSDIGFVEKMNLTGKREILSYSEAYVSLMEKEETDQGMYDEIINKILAII